jgi:hypothetical protein
MDEQLFCEAVNVKAKESGINPMLLLSGIEGWYTFRHVPLNTINYDFLDSLILTIFALRIGDQFHTLAEENLLSPSEVARLAAGRELKEMTNEEIANSSNQYLHSFATILDGKSTIRRYHEKALEVAALEVRKAQIVFGNNSISTIVINVCATDQHLNLGTLFRE